MNRILAFITTTIISTTTFLIPHSDTNLDLGPRESSRDSTIVNGSILEIWTRLRSSNPEALAQSKFQVGGRVWYNSSEDLSIENALKNQIILCTGPSLGRREMLKLYTEKDMQLIPFKKIFLSTNDPNNLDLTFLDQMPSCELIPLRDKQLDCLNCIISTINAVANDPECDDDDIIIFKHESVYISDMNLVKKAIGKILDGYDMVVKYWIGFPQTYPSSSLNDYYHTDSFYLRVGSARQFLKNHPLVPSFTSDYQFCEEYFTKHIVSRLPYVFSIDYHHSSWKDNELGFYHIPRYDEDPTWYWGKKNYDEIYR